MRTSRFVVASEPSRWRFWTIPHLWVHIASTFDEPGHPYGQWSARLTKLSAVDSETPWLLRLEFLVDEAPWRQILPGMMLSCFDGPKHIADVTVQEDATPV